MTEPRSSGQDDAEAAYAGLLRLWPRLREWLRPDQAVVLWRQAAPAGDQQTQEDSEWARMRRRVRTLAEQRRSRITPRVRRPLPGVVVTIAGEPEPASTTTPPPENGEVEVAHEALIRHWPRLREWLEQDRAALLLRESVREAAQEWERANREESYLTHRGRRLGDALALRQHPRLRLNPLEDAYIAASLALREREEQEREAQQQRELTAQRERAELAEAARHEAEQRVAEQAVAAGRLRRRFLVAAGLGALAVLAAIYAFYNFQEAGQQRNIAQEQSVAAVAAETAVVAASTAEAERIRADEQSRISLTQALAAQAITESERGEHERGALLAQQAYLVDLENGGSARAQVDRALRAAVGVRPWTAPPLPRGAAAPPSAAADYVYSAEVSALAFGPDGATLVAAQEDGTVWAWDLGRREAAIPRTPAGLPAAVTAVALEQRGRLLAVASDDGGVRVWTLDDPAREPTVLAGPGSRIDSLAFGPDGRAVAGGTVAGALAVWDLEQPGSSPTMLQPPDADGAARPAAGVSALAFIPTGDVVAAGRADGTVVLWAVGAIPGRPARDPVILPGPPDAGGTPTITALAFLPDRQLLAAAVAGGVATWNLGAGTPAPPTWLPGTRPTGDQDRQTAFVTVAFGPVGRTLVAGGQWPGIVWWDTARLGDEPRALEAWDPVTAVAFGPDGHTLASASGGAVRLHDFAPPGCVTVLSAARIPPLTALALDPDGRSVAAGAEDGVVRLWRLDEPQVAPVVLGLPGDPTWPGSRVRPASVSPAATPSVSGEVVCDQNGEASPDLMLGYDNAVTAVVFGPGGDVFAARRDGTVAEWDPNADGASDTGARGTALTLPSVPQGFVPDALSVTAEGRAVVVWRDQGGGALVVDQRRTPPGPTPLSGLSEGITAVALSRDGSTAAAGGDGGSVAIWRLDRPDGAPRVLGGAGVPVAEVALSADGGTLGAAMADGSLATWDLTVDSGEPAQRRPSDARVTALAISPNGTTLAAGRDDGAVALWSLGPDTFGFVVVHGNDGAVQGVVFGLDGKLVASTGWDTDGTVRVWWTTAALFEAVCPLVWRNLTPEVWRQVVGDPEQIPYQPTCPNLPPGSDVTMGTPVNGTPSTPSAAPPSRGTPAITDTASPVPPSTEPANGSETLSTFSILVRAPPDGTNIGRERAKARCWQC